MNNSIIRKDSSDWILDRNLIRPELGWACLECCFCEVPKIRRYEYIDVIGYCKKSVVSFGNSDERCELKKHFEKV